MKKQYDALKKLVFALVLLFAGVQGVFAMMDCDGTIYLKLPDGWRTAFAVGGGNFDPFKASRTHSGWYELSASDAGGDHSVPGFNIVTANGDYGQKGAITPRGITEAGDQVSLQEASGFKCSHFGATGELWIEPDPANPTKVRYSGAPADVKFFYIYLPDDVKWKSSVPMISVGGAAGKPMDSDPNRCGWFYKRYVDEDPPSSVLIYRDDDELMAEAIGMEGDWATGAPTPIDLANMFTFLNSNEIYFVASADAAKEMTSSETAGWAASDPTNVKGNCGYDLAAMIYDTDASLHGAFTCSHWESQCTADNQAPCQNNSCYYPNAPYNVVNSATAIVPCIGVTTGMVEDILGPDKKPKLTASGKKCFGSKADEAFTAMFNPTPGVNEAYCFNLPFTQADDGKYEFDSDDYQSPGATVPGGFYPAEKTPTEFLEGSEHLPAAENKRFAQGPVFFCTGPQQGGGDGLRAIDPTEGVPVIDLFCKGPNGAWDGGVDCEGLFAHGNEFDQPTFRAPRGVNYEGDGWGWSCPNAAPLGWRFYESGTETPTGEKQTKNNNPEGDARWNSGNDDTAGDVYKGKGRNQHFCFESHASFRYKKGLRFNFRGDDDIWVYIDNKLAVDLGGTHLAAPAYVDLDKFVGASGGFQVGTEYDIDIFFCDRRTTMSNVRIKTNMYIKQTSGISKDMTNEDDNGHGEYKVCYAVSSNGSCGGGSGMKICGDSLCDYLVANGKTIDYTLYKVKGDGKKDTIKTAAELAAASVYFKGGIDLTNRCNPVIDRLLMDGLGAGNYSLEAKIDQGGGTETWTFSQEGDMEVVNANASAIDLQNKNVDYTVVKAALASSRNNPTRVPIYITKVMGSGDDLQLDFEGAVGEYYVLTIEGENPGSVVLEYKDSTGNFVQFNSKSTRVIGNSGIDTVYASLEMGFMNSDQVTYNFKVNNLVLPVTFYVPRLKFVASETDTALVKGDDPNYERFVGPVYTFYLYAEAPSMTNPGTYEPCGERCNFALNFGETSLGITTADSASMVMINGRATISIYSTKEYRVAGDGVADNPAILTITGPQSNLIFAEYKPLHFKKPPVPYPVFADIFDARGVKSSVELNMKDPYFESSKDYLDGIADSLVIYYNRPFYNSPDSIPDKIVVHWDDEDSVVVEKSAFINNMRCGAKAEPKLDDTLCMQRVSIGGVNFSKDIKTANLNANLNSYASYSDRGKIKKDAFPGVIKDRVAPFILSADVHKQNDKVDVMTVWLSEPVDLRQTSLSTTAFTAYLNSAANLKSADQKYIEGIESVSAAVVGDDKVTLYYEGTDEKPTPHTGDYIRFRADLLVWSDKANISILGDTLRDHSDGIDWNSPTSYNVTNRVPTPWTPVTGEAEVGVKSITYTMVDPDIVNKVKKGDIKITTVTPYDVTVDFEDVKKLNPGKLGYFLKSDMNSLIYSDTTISKWFTNPEHQADVKDIFLEVQMDLFSNLGSFVAHDVVRIKCTDEEIYGVGHSCLDTQRNFFISWNLVSAEKRLVGTGAYVSKMKSSVSLPKFGRKNKMDETQMWGVRRTKKAKKLTAELVEQ